jgi:uncharacterized protein (UPF0276 family)
VASFTIAQPARGPLLATTFTGDDLVLLRRLVPLVDVIELAPETLVHSRGGRLELRSELLEALVEASTTVKFVVHGVGLSIGSADSWNDDYLRLLDELLDHISLGWHSEHLGCTTVDGENLGTMLALPRTSEALDLVCERVERLAGRYRLPFLLEHVAGILPEPDSEFSAAGFLNQLAGMAPCGLVLDARNLECDRFNHGLNIANFLAELNFESVRELHLAGGVEYQGVALDIHSRLTCPGTRQLAAEIARRSPNLSLVTYEYLKEAIPVLGHDAICDELELIREELLLPHVREAEVGVRSAERLKA